jgi:hypothetical protein
MLLTLLINYVSSVSSNVTRSLPLASGNEKETQDTDFCLCYCMKFELITVCVRISPSEVMNSSISAGQQ